MMPDCNARTLPCARPAWHPAAWRRQGRRTSIFFGTASIAVLTAAAPIDAPLTIDNFAFSAARLDIAAGTRVTWTNRDDIPHTVTAAEAPRTIKSRALDTGETYTRLFALPGTYRYFCSLHPRMQGMVVVH